MATEQELEKTSPLRQKFSEMLEKDFEGRTLKENEIIKAKVVEILKGHVVVDCRGKSEAMIANDEFTREELSKIKVGDTLECFLERLESMKTGEIVLSYRKAKSLRAWKKCLIAHEKGESLSGYIRSRIKGGFVLELFDGAISAFLPQSHLDIRPIKGAAVERLMNTPISVLVSRVEKSRGNLSVSRRDLLSLNKSAETAEALKSISVGMVCDTTVRSIQSWGVFVNYVDPKTKGSLDFLVHISDLDYSRVKNPNDLTSVGASLRCVITKIDPNTNHISASCKDLNSDPYENIEKRYLIGSVYSAEIVKLQPYGAFAALEKNVEGLIHASNIDHLVKNINPSKIFSVGDKVKVKVLSVEKDKRRIALSYKDNGLFANPWDKVKDLVGKETKVRVNNVSEKAVFVELVDIKLVGMLPWKELSYTPNIEDLKKYKKGDLFSAKLVSYKDEKLRFSVRDLEPHPLLWFENSGKKVGSIITTTVVEVLKTGVKVAVDPEKKIIVTIKKNQLAVEPEHCRPEIYSKGDKMADARIESIDFTLNKVVLSPRAAQQLEQDSLVKKFGEGAAKSGMTLKNIFQSALGKKKKKKEEK